VIVTRYSYNGCMKSIVLLFVLMSGLMGAEAVMTRYKVMLSLFGKVGEATITVAHRGDEYRMIVEDYATGLAAKVSGNERDRFVSIGHVKDGFYISDRFEMHQTNDTTVESNVYIFDHEAKTVTRYQDKNETVTDRSFNAMTMGFEEQTRQKISKKTKVLDFYSPYDALSVVLNFPKLLSNGKRVEIKPVGLAKKERKMYISLPAAEALPDMFDEFDYPGISHLVQLDSLEVQSDDEYGVLVGYDARGNIDEVVTKETYFFIGYGRIVKLDEMHLNPDAIFDK
jgi:hypothetical protein